MTDYKTDGLWLMQGDCLERMKEIPDNSIDLCVSDIPYKLTGGGKGDGGTAHASQHKRQPLAAQMIELQHHARNHGNE